MKDWKTIHKAYWEAIRVEYKLKRSHLQKSNSQEPENSMKTSTSEIKHISKEPGDKETDNVDQQPEAASKEKYID